VSKNTPSESIILARVVSVLKVYQLGLLRDFVVDSLQQPVPVPLLVFCSTPSSRSLCFAACKTVVHYFGVTSGLRSLRSPAPYAKSAVLNNFEVGFEVVVELDRVCAVFALCAKAPRVDAAVLGYCRESLRSLRSPISYIN